MRKKLDGREYVENYVHHLAHEMRSPLTALIGSAELLDEKMPPQEHAAFTSQVMVNAFIAGSPALQPEDLKLASL